MFLFFTLLACFTDPNSDTGDTGEPQCDAYPAPRFTIFVVDAAGDPLTADSAWAEDDAGTRYEGSCDDAACTEWSGIAADGRVTLYAEASGVVSEGVEDEIIRNDANCSIESAEATVQIGI